MNRTILLIALSLVSLSVATAPASAEPEFMIVGLLEDGCGGHLDTSWENCGSWGRDENGEMVCKRWHQCQGWIDIQDIERCSKP